MGAVTDLNFLSARQEALETSNETLREGFRTLDGDAHTALEVAKQNIKLMTALRATQLAHGEAIASLVTEVADVRSEVADVRAEVAGVRSEVADVRAEVAGVRSEVADVRAEVAGVKSEVADVRAELAGVKAEVAELKVDVNGRLGMIESEIKDGLAEVLRRLPA
jgi:chromosome segregation ATPase